MQAFFRVGARHTVQRFPFFVYRSSKTDGGGRCLTKYVNATPPRGPLGTRPMHGLKK